MAIKDFLELCSGKWFSQRTHYNLAREKVDNSKADLSIELLSAEDPEVEKICSKLETIGGLKSSWDTSVDWAKTKEVGSSLLIFAQDGHLFSQAKSLWQGSYSLEQDEMLVLKLETDNQQIEERIWFPSPNLRLRTTIVKQDSPQTTFYSEIRKLSPS